jgi:hypothetical protein
MKPEPQELRIATDSGDACAATFYRPPDAEGAVPCVVMGAGGALTRRDGIPGYAERFAAAGFAALAFDYRHWGQSEGEPRRLVSIPRQLADWRSAVAHARGIEGVDAGRIVVWGMSFGGGHAVTTASEDARIAAAVALVPMADGLAFSLTPRFMRFSARLAAEPDGAVPAGAEGQADRGAAARPARRAGRPGAATSRREDRRPGAARRAAPLPDRALRLLLA